MREDRAMRLARAASREPDAPAEGRGPQPPGAPGPAARLRAVSGVCTHQGCRQARDPLHRRRILPLLRHRALAAGGGAQPVRHLHRPARHPLLSHRRVPQLAHADLLQIHLYQQVPGVRPGGDHNRQRADAVAAAHPGRAGAAGQIRRPALRPSRQFGGHPVHRPGQPVPDPPRPVQPPGVARPHLGPDRNRRL